MQNVSAAHAVYIDTSIENNAANNPLIILINLYIP